MGETETITIVMDGREIEVLADNRLVSQIQNLQEKQAEQVYDEQRNSFKAAALEAINGLLSEEETGHDAEALEGMSLIIPLDGTVEDVVLTQSAKVIVKQRMPKAAAAAEGS
jgi:hypothetical protein